MPLGLLCRHSLGPYQDMAAVVIDTGTGFTKCGLAGEDHVLSVLPSRVQLLQHPVQGQPRYTPELSTAESLCLFCLPARATPAHRVNRIQISLGDSNRGYGVMPLPTAILVPNSTMC
uniref:Uncharacterized protein n=1 Tax=Moschus moschiferus TaxID=68415 RepID=A0A8C6E5D5_MOSMO